MQHEDHCSGGGLTRRRALQAAALGVTTTLTRPQGALGHVADTSRHHGEVRAMEGTLVGLSSKRMVVEHLHPGADAPVRMELDISSRSVGWRGFTTGVDKLDIGRTVLVRRRGKKLDKAWQELTRIKGTVVDVSSRSFVLRPDGLGDAARADVEVVPQLTTVARNVGTLVETVGFPPVRVGALADVVGMAPGYGYSRAAPPESAVEPFDPRTDDPDTLFPSVMDFVLGPTHSVVPPLPPEVPDDALGEPSLPVPEAVPDSDPPPTRRGPQDECRYVYVGTATYFPCPCGEGRCQTCNPAYDHQLAWPAMDGSCRCCDFYCCNCSSRCKKQVRLSCGSRVSVEDYCHNRTRVMEVVSCGPSQRNACSGAGYQVCGFPCKHCGRTKRTPIVDLTTPSFALYWDPDAVMCFPAMARVRSRRCI